MKIRAHILPTIVIAQFLCTSLWFAGNGILSELKLAFDLGEGALAYLTSSVQLGFISGTLLFALLSIADRFSPSKVFFICALLGASFNLLIFFESNSFYSILGLHYLTGFFLAGIYPVGMKIAADYFAKGLGKSLGYLVGALVLGTALPHLITDIRGQLPWQSVLISTSSLAVMGGLLMYLLVPDGPFRKANQQIQLNAIPKVFKEVPFRAAAFGYFGHMWELYTFWAFVPVILVMYMQFHSEVALDKSLLSFSIIGIGGLACVLGGYLAQKYTAKRIAFLSLLLSTICCLTIPIIMLYGSATILVVFLLFWGMVVIADSPLFSTLVAQNAPIQLKGTALTIVNSIGFAITIISIQLMNILSVNTSSPFVFMILGLGPILGLYALSRQN